MRVVVDPRPARNECPDLVAGDLFDRWKNDAAYPTLFPVDRPVRVEIARALPAGGARVRQDTLPLWVRGCGLRLEPWMTARQVAWVRRSDGGFLAVVLLDAASANGHSAVTMQLWLGPESFTTDLSAGH